MKKVILFALILIAFEGIGQRISGPTNILNNERALPVIPVGAFFFEGFENGNLGALPSQWTTSSVGDSGFYTGIGGSIAGQANENGFWPVPIASVFAMTNDDVCNCDKSQDYLTSKIFNLIGLQKVFIGFQAFQNGAGNQQAYVQVTNNGSDWVNLAKINRSNTWADQELLIPKAYYTNHFQFRFYYTDGGGYASGLALDNIYLKQSNSVVSSTSYYTINGNDTLSSSLYESIPLSQARNANFQFGAQFTNNSQNTRQVKLSLTIPNALNDTSNVWTSFPDEITHIQTSYGSRFSPSQTGTYNCIFRIFEEETNLELSPVSLIQFGIGDSSYHWVDSKTDGTGIWIQNAPEEIGSIFHIFNSDTLRGVNVQIHPSTAANSRIKLKIYDAEDFTSTLYESAALLIPQSSIGSNFRFKIDSLFNEGKYLVSIQKIIGNVVLSSTSSKTASNGQVLYKKNAQPWNPFPYFPFVSLIFDGIDSVCSDHIDASISPENCTGSNNASISIDQSKLRFPSTYSWSNGSSNPDINSLSAGNYSVTILDSTGCIYSKNFTIEPQDSLMLEASIIKDSCTRGVGSIAVFPSGGTSPYQLINAGDTIPSTIGGLNGGSYTFTIFDFNGCSISKSFNVEGSDSLSIVQDLILPNCGMSNGQISTQVSGSDPFTYHWSNGDSLAIAQNLSAGIYQLTISDSIGCTDVIDIILNDSSDLEITSLVEDETCLGTNSGSIDITTTGGTIPVSFSWSNGMTNEDLNNVSAGKYQLTITDQNLCKAIYVEKIDFEKNPVQVAIAEEGIFCSNLFGKAQALVSSSEAVVSYSWSTGASSMKIDSLESGAISVTVTDTSGCQSFDSAVVYSRPPLTVHVDSTQILSDSNGFVSANIFTSVVGGTPAYKFTWSNGFRSKNLFNLDTGVYELNVIDGFGCTSRVTKYISNDLTSNSWPKKSVDPSVIFPNPSLGTGLNISANYPIKEIEINDITGKQIGLSYFNSTHFTSVKFQQPLQPGVYFVRLTNVVNEVEILKAIVTE